MKLDESSLVEEESRLEWLKETIYKVNRLLFDYAAENEDFKGMGTTLEAALVYGRTCLISHIGDSRVYTVNHDSINQVTKDHSYVNILVESGEITEEEATKHPQRNWIMKALGSERTIDPDFYSVELENELYLLICTDGLSNKVDDESIHSIILGDTKLSGKVEALVAMANKMGGEDNISVILLCPADTEVPEQ